MGSLLRVNSRGADEGASELCLDLAASFANRVACASSSSSRGGGMDAFSQFLQRLNIELCVAPLHQKSPRRIIFRSSCHPLADNSRAILDLMLSASAA